MGNAQSDELPPSSAATALSALPRDGDSDGSDSGDRRNGQFVSDHGRRPPLKCVQPPATLSAPPTVSLVSRGGPPSTSTSTTHAIATVSASSRTSHQRVRSLTVGATPSSQSTGVTVDPRRPSLEQANMGNSDSKPRPPSRSAAAQASDSAQAPPSPKPLNTQLPSHTRQPQPARHESQQEDTVSPDYDSPYGLPPATFTRPPRLPLPIDAEIQVPGSPIITPQDIASPLYPNDVEGALPRRESVLSSTTVDDDDVGDNDTFEAETSQSMHVKIPTRLEWNGRGDKIFVTGTFCNWERKIKLHRNKDRAGFSATIMLPPGTHHIKFLVDNDMLTSPDLPTTVDWTNILVNYIEIVAPMPSKSEAKPSEPMPIPGAAITAGQAISTDEGATRPVAIGESIPGHESEADAASSLKDTVSPSPGHKSTPVAIPSAQPQVQESTGSQRETKQTPIPVKQRLPRAQYTNQIPAYLLDLDNFINAEDDDRSRRVSKAVDGLPQPPSLPMFLGKSILNGTTPHKDDASVLLMPNHTVLNHLATSSIKSGVLATSATTRYKRKVRHFLRIQLHYSHITNVYQFLTTIMYKPTSDDG